MAADRICRTALCSLFCLLLFATGCDQAPKEPARECTTFEGCTTLSGLSSVRDEPFVATDAIVLDSTLYVAMTSMTRRFDGDIFDPDDIFVLSRPLGSNAGHPDSNWTMKRLTHDPATRFGGFEGRGSLAIDPSGTLRYLWGELVPFDSTESRSPASRVWESSLSVSTWETPTVAAELNPKPIRSISGPELTGSFVSSDTEMILSYQGSGNQSFGDARMIHSTGNGWRKDVLFGGNLETPKVAVKDGIMVSVFVEIGTADQEEPEGLVVRRSMDQGVTWTSPVEIKSGGSVPGDTFIKTSEPQILVAPDGTFHILFVFDTPPTGYFGNEVWHTKSRDDGQTWSRPRAVNPLDRGFVSQVAATFTPGGNLHLLYYQGPRFASPDGNRVRYAVWNGTDWQQQPDISNTSLMFDRDLGIAASSDGSGCVHAVWDEFTNWDAKTSQFRYERLGC